MFNGRRLGGIWCTRRENNADMGKGLNSSHRHLLKANVTVKHTGEYFTRIFTDYNRTDLFY